MALSKKEQADKNRRQKLRKRELVKELCSGKSFANFVNSVKGCIS